MTKYIVVITISSEKVSQLVGALKLVKHKGLHQGWEKDSEKYIVSGRNYIRFLTQKSACFAAMRETVFNNYYPSVIAERQL